MPDLDDKSSAMRGKAVMGNSDGMKVVVYNDIWEQYHMCFTIWHPDDDSKDEWAFESKTGQDA